METRLTIEKVVAGGRGLGHFEGKTVFVDGALPGEEVRVNLPESTAPWAVAALLEIAKPSPKRSLEVEDHALACSPWQGVDYAYQVELKRHILAEIYTRPNAQLKVKAMVGSDSPSPMTGYRNKIEFGLIPAEDQSVTLGLHERGSAQRLVPAPNGCHLATERMNTVALAVVQRLSALKLGAEALTLTVRESSHAQQVIAIVGVARAARHDWQRLYVPKLDGLIIATRTKAGFGPLLWSRGQTTLTEKVGGLEYQYSWDSFFQGNVPMFERVLNDVQAAVEPKSTVADLYGGVGLLGLAVAGTADRVIGIEVDSEAVHQAVLNAQRMGTKNYVGRVESVEKLNPGIIEGFQTVIVDPPRAGLAKSVVETLKAVHPQTIIYVSCDPYTQARDVALLSDYYQADSVTGYDLYPGTPHIESLVVLRRKLHDKST